MAVKGPSTTVNSRRLDLLVRPRTLFMPPSAVLAASVPLAACGPRARLSAYRMHPVAAGGISSAGSATRRGMRLRGAMRRARAQLPIVPRDSARRCDMTSPEKKMVTAVPDLREFPLDRLAELGASPLAHSIALYRERLKENGIPLSSFNARI